MTIHLTGGGSPIATQAEMEAASNVKASVTPGRAKYHPGTAKFWIVFNGTGTIATLASYNVASITDNGAGDYTITIDTDFSSANYSAVGMCSQVSGETNSRSVEIQDSGAGMAAGSLRVVTLGPSGLEDRARVCIAGFGDQ